MTPETKARDRKARRWVNDRLAEYYAWLLSVCQADAEGFLDRAIQIHSSRAAVPAQSAPPVNAGQA
jgi:hypothetical protein